MKIISSTFLLLTAAASADLQLPRFFSDGMVLQRDTSAKIWGTGTPGKTVVITFNEKTAGSSVDKDGKWLVELKGLKATSKGKDLNIVSGNSRQTIKDVVVGEVWLASGQSNMEWTISRSSTPKKFINEGNDPLLRVYVSGNIAENKPQTNFIGSWRHTAPENTGSFTAVGYHFARALREKLNVPVGIIECAWGGRPIQAFTSPEALETLPIGKELLEQKAKAIAKYDPVKSTEDFQKKLAKWKETKKGRRPRKPSDPSKNSSLASTIYNGMIAPLAGYGIRGAIWYQGESNANPKTAQHYAALLETMAKDWRKQWGQDLSFYWVQLANFRQPATEPGTTTPWVIVQDQMRRALKTIDKGGMAVINDIGMANDIHPRNKHDVGFRLARWAFHQDYKITDQLISGPLYKSFEKKDGKLVITFDYARGLKTSDKKAPARFEISDSNGKWHWATATIEGKNVILSHKDVKDPQHARYAWSINPEGANLVNLEGLPTSCFTTESETPASTKK